MSSIPQAITLLAAIINLCLGMYISSGDGDKAIDYGTSLILSSIALSLIYGILWK
jgi:hypothetical protein